MVFIQCESVISELKVKEYFNKFFYKVNNKIFFIYSLILHETLK
jgi:hypothetical protein